MLLEKELELAGCNGGVLVVRRNQRLRDRVFDFVLVDVELERHEARAGVRPLEDLQTMGCLVAVFCC